MGEIERPDLCEQIGVAVGAAQLIVEPEHPESHLVRVAAMGGASRRIARANDRMRPWHPMERDQIEARLAPLLWRLVYGGDAAVAVEAVRLFARWLAGTFSWRNHPVHGDLAQRFAARLIHEWLAHKCTACRGTGQQELLRNGRTRTPRRFGEPDVRLVACRACHGGGNAYVDAAARARALEVSLAEYRGVWAGRMDRAAVQLRGVAHRFKKPLRSELERDYNRA